MKIMSYPRRMLMPGVRISRGKPTPQLCVTPASRRAEKCVRVALIVGDNHTRHCGVKDHALILADALSQIDGVKADVLAPDAWNPRLAWKLMRHLRKERYDILHLQYPSIGYRTSLIPHILGLLRPASAAVITLHEFSALPRAQQLSTHVFRWSANKILFGSEYERSRFNSTLGPLGAAQQVFPILSQVPSVPSSTGRDATVVYFGQIRPDKGLEAFLELAQHSIHLGKKYQFYIVGSVSKAHEAYAQSLQAQASPQVRWSFDLSFQEVGAILGRSFAAYLPFPDGASERRGSLAAAWLNGLPTLSQVGAATTQAMRELLVIVHTANEALNALEQLATKPNEYERVSCASRQYAENRTWENVARQHADIYRALLLAR